MSDVASLSEVAVADYPLGMSMQLPKARHGAEARKAPKVDFSDIISEFVKRKTRKLFYYSIFSILS